MSRDAVPPLAGSGEPAGVSAAGVGAFFDMDYTVLRASSGLLYLRYLRQRRHLSRRRWLVVMVRVALYAAGATAFPRLMAQLMKDAAGAGEAAAWQLSAEWYRDMLRHYVAPRARERIAWHRAQGHHVALVSASTPYAVRFVAEDLGLGDAYLATRLELAEGRFTGRVLEPACFGEGKVVLVRQYAADRGLDLSRSYFYSDSARDMPLLLAVGNPVAVNPSRRLRRLATQRRWPIVSFY